MLALGFLSLVAVPLVAAAWYLFAVAADQFHSEAAFSVRSEDQAGSAALGVLGAITRIGGGGASEGDILDDFIRSAAMVRAVDARLDLRALWSKAPGDPVFGFPGGPAVEDLHDYWLRMVHLTHDSRAGTLTLRVHAFAPQDAQAIAQAVIAESGRLVNTLSDQARRDAVRFAEADLNDAQSGLRGLRAQLAAFRDETRLISPEADVAGQMGVVGALQGELAEAMIARDTLLTYAEATDHRVVQAERRIAAINDRIAAERRTLGTGTAETVPSEVMGRYEAILTDIEFAQAAYTQALTNLAVARAEAMARVEII